MSYWNQSRDYFQAASCRLTTTKAKTKTFSEGKAKNTESITAAPISSAEPAAAGASTKENPRLPYATGSTGLAIKFRSSSRIMVMRFRPANIRLINRRSNCSSCSLCLREKKTQATKTNPQILPLDTVTRYQMEGRCTHRAGNRCGLVPQRVFELSRWRDGRYACNTSASMGRSDFLNRLSPFSFNSIAICTLQAKLDSIPID